MEGFGAKHGYRNYWWFGKTYRYNLKTKTLTIIKHCQRAGEAQKDECEKAIEFYLPYVHQLQNFFVLTGNELKHERL